MANHLRRQIRDAMKTALTGLSTTGANCFASSVYPLQDGELPALRISMLDEAIQSEIKLSGGVHRLERTLAVQVEAAVKAVTGFEDTADQVVKEVEIALAANRTLGGLCRDMLLRRVQVQLSGDGEKPLALTSMIFEVSYRTAATAPDVLL